MLPEFSLDYQPQPEHAKEDRLSIHFGNWFLDTTEPRFRHLRRRLAPPPENSAHPEQFGWLFAVPSAARMVTEAMRVRKPRGFLTGESLPETPFPLFTGNLHCFQETRAGGRRRYKLQARLSLNAIRYAHYLNLPRPAECIRPGFEQLCQGITRHEYGGEFPLEREFRDNWIPEVFRLYSMAASPAHWQENLRRYLTGARNAIHSELARVAGLYDLELESEDDDYSLRQAEIAFDLRHENPLGLLHSLDATLRRLAALYTRQEHEPPPHLPENDLNCPSWTFRISRGVSVRLYAKTNRRLRLEVIHDFTKQGRSHTFTSLSAVCSFLQSLRAESASILSDFMDRLRALNPPVWRPCSPFGFVTRWFAALPRGSESLGHDLLRVLAYQGSIRLAANDPFRPLVLALRRHGLVHHVGDGDVVTAEWHLALQGLQTLLAQDTFPPCRVRTRAPRVRYRPE